MDCPECRATSTRQIRYPAAARMALLWTIFVGFMLVLVCLDLFVLRRLGRHANPDAKEPARTHVAYAVFWLVLGMLFTFAVYFLYDRQMMDAGLKDGYTEALSGTDATLQYLSAFLLELVLNIDSVFVIAAVFAASGVREAYRHRLLMWGMLVAMLTRGGMILLTGELLFEFAWVRFILAALLGMAALRMMLVRKENLDPNKNLAFKILKRFLPMGRSEDSSLVTLENGKAALTPLIVPMLLIETADLFLAFDSIPASYAFSREPLLIFAGSCFAMLVVRSLVPVLASLIERLRYFKLGLAAILVYSAVVIAMPASKILAGYQTEGWKLTAAGKLGFLGFAIVFGLLVAWFANPRSTRSDVSALGEDADRVMRGALTNVRKAMVFTVGIIGLIGGAIMAIGPGPGIPVLFIAALLLAGEFAWARRIVDKYRSRRSAQARAVAADSDHDGIDHHRDADRGVHQDPDGIGDCWGGADACGAGVSWLSGVFLQAHDAL
jgi:tellurite resistance protein TerC